jgi:hypothetical protein
MAVPVFNVIRHSISISLLFLSFLFCEVSAQTKFTLSGKIKDAQSGESLIGASIRPIGISGNGTSTNSYGFYSISAPSGKLKMLISYIGYQTYAYDLVLKGDTTINIALTLDNLLQEVVVTDKVKNQQVTKAQMGIEKVNMAAIKDVPVLFGEKDVLKTLQLLPGIKSAGEGNSGFYVRGGSSDQNLILLDEANVYNASHLLGFFSTFNSDAIKDVSVYKGGMPAQYGGRLASVVDIKMNDGNQKRYTAEGGIGLISSRLKIEGPVFKDRGSFMISGRRTYADLFLAFSGDSSLKGSQLFFYDLNAKANYRINEKNTIYLSGYLGRDVLGLKKTFNLNWGNKTATFRWNHLFNNKLFSNTSLIYSDYNYEIQFQNTQNDLSVISAIQDINFKQDYQYFASNGHSLHFGFNANHHTIEPGKITASQTSAVNPKSIENRNGLEADLYISDDWQVNSRLSMIYGLRLSSFSLFGPGNFNTYDNNGSVTSEKVYSGGQLVKFYLNYEPRFSASYLVGESSSVKASFNRNSQNLHLLSNSTASLPTDLWVMSSNNIKPEIANQVALGYYQNFKNDLYEFSSEVYYKSMEKQIDYKNAAELRANENVESELLFGKGRAYGIEFFIKKRTGKLNGWLGYTLSKTERQFDGISPDYFPAKQDRTHDLSLVTIYKLSKRWTFSGTFVYSTGNAVTFPSGKYNLEGQTNYYYTERNGYRMPDYHRFDFAATLDGKANKKFKSSWTFGLYNSYNRHNAYVIEFQNNPDDKSRTQIVQTALFGIIPSITWNFKF